MTQEGQIRGNRAAQKCIIRRREKLLAGEQPATQDTEKETKDKAAGRRGKGVDARATQPRVEYQRKRCSNAQP